MASCNGNCTIISNITNDLNETVIVDVLPDGFQHASGQTILWALVALALAAMTQSSQTAEYVGLYDKTYVGETSIHRVSPILCLFDAIAEIFLLVRALLFLPRSQVSRNINERQSNEQSDENDSTNGTAGEVSSDIQQTSATLDDSAGQSSLPLDTAHHLTNASQSPGRVPSDDAASTDANLEAVPEAGTDDIDRTDRTTPQASNDAERSNEQSENSMASEQQVAEAQTEETVVSYDSQHKDIVVGKFISAVQAALEAIPNTDGTSSPSRRDRTINTWSGRSFRDVSDNVISKCFDIVKKSKKRQNNPANKTSSTIYCMKMSIFVLGALPQSIKLFAIQGIPFTQAIAATYFVAIIVHGLRLFVDSIASSKPDEHAKSWCNEKTTWSLLEMSHWLTSIVLWANIVDHIQPPYIVHQTLIDNTPIPIAAFITLTAIVGGVSAFRTPCIPVQRRWLINHYYWAYAVSSTLVWVVYNSQPERSLGLGAFSRLNWQFGKYIDYFIAQFMFIIPLLALPILPCILVAQMIRWSSVALSKLQMKDETQSEETQELISMDEPTKRAHEVVDTFRELIYVVAKGESKKIETAAEFSHRRRTRSWAAYMREAFVQLARVMSCVLNPSDFLDKAKDWLSNLHYEVKWTAFLIFNILTATMYYTLCFDSTVTAQPSWTAVLG